MPYRFGTVLVSPEPFSAGDLETIEDVARRMKFDIVLSPRVSLEPAFVALAAGPDLQQTLDRMPSNVAAPTDDDPFFFHTARLRDLARLKFRQSGVLYTNNIGAVAVLAALLAIVTLLTALCIFVPLLLNARREVLRGSLPWIVYFCAIGMGFMLVEISQMQRLIVFLGHPIYGLTVVLFSLLLSSGIGSYWSETIGWKALALLPVLLAVFGAVTPQVTHTLDGATTPVRIGVAVLVLGILGVFMGMAFPLGMRAASRRNADLTPWLWGVNGATSICASVFAVAISIHFGIAATFWTGWVSYTLASASYWIGYDRAI